MSRLIFSNLKGFKKTVTEHFLVALREIYKSHPAYTWMQDSAKTKIRIIPTHSNPTYEGRTPELLVKVGSYQFALQDYLYGNLYEEVSNSVGVIGGYRALKNMRTNVSIRVRSFYAEQSEDIADELAMLGVYSAHHMFAQLGLNIQGTQVTETVESEEVNDWYDTVVNFTVDVPWEVRNVSNKAAPETEVELAPEEGEITNDYREPGTYIFKEKED